MRMLGWTLVCVSAATLAGACGTAAPTWGQPGEGGQPSNEPETFGNSASFETDGGGRGNASDGQDASIQACATDTQKAKLAPLHLMLMQDTSGSMWDYVSGTTTKWDSIKQALGGFMSDPASAGIGLGLQFFPLFGNNVPNSCMANAECNGGSCVRNLCSNSRKICETNGECGNGTCLPLKRCHNAQEVLCRDDTDCFVIPYGFLGSCDRPLVRGQCDTATLSCQVPNYQALAAPFAPLPGAATAVNAALGARIPRGQTPTHAALSGAIQAAKTFATAHPNDVVAVVLSTDGIPYTNGSCDDDVAHIRAVAAAGANGTPSIKTFVIGVLSPSDATGNATATLNGIASSGGTNAATILGTSANTVTDFIAALQKVRGQSLPCQFKLPVPEAGTPDYGKVNVVFTDSKTNTRTVIGYVADKAQCDPVKGGWYYDANPASGGKPSQVVLCPATCATVQADPTGSVEVVQGCATTTQPGPR